MRTSTGLTDTCDLTMEQFQSALRLEYDEEDQIKQMREFCLHSSSNDIRKKGMEFLLMNDYYDDLEELIKTNRESTEFSNRQWAEVYQIFLELKFQKYEANNMLRRIKDIDTDEPELRCLLEFAKVKVQDDMNCYHELGNSLFLYGNLIREVNDFFMLNSLKTRYFQMELIYRLMRNELIVARKYGYKLINQTNYPGIIMDTHIKLGLSYTFDSYFQAMKHMKEALTIAKKYNLASAIYLIEQQNIPFLCAHYKKVDHISTIDKGERGHIEITKGNNQKAIEILEEVPMNSPFLKYYLGMAKQDKTLLIQAYKDFVHKRSDYFFSRLPLNELRKIFF